MAVCGDGYAWNYRTVPVMWDRERVIAEFDESGLSDKAMVWARCIIGMIRDRDAHHLGCIVRAGELAHEDGYDGGWILPEKYWDAAARELGI